MFEATFKFGEIKSVNMYFKIVIVVQYCLPLLIGIVNLDHRSLK